MRRGSQGTTRGRTSSHGIPTSRSKKLSIASPKRSHAKQGTTRIKVAEITAKTDLATKIDLAAKTGPAMMTGPIAKTYTIAKTATRKAEEKRGAEGKNTILLFPWEGPRSLDQ